MSNPKSHLAAFACLCGWSARARPLASSGLSGRELPWSPTTTTTLRTSRPFRRAVLCSASRSDDGSRDSEFDITDLPRSTGSGSDSTEVEKRNELFEFVKQVPPPELVAKFAKAAPPVVQKAIRQTIVSMLGTLPLGAFYPSVKTVSANLVQLFHSSLISGYMFRNATYRLELTRSLDAMPLNLPALPGTTPLDPEIVGGVAVFQAEDGSKVSVPVDQYVSELRNQVQVLKDELARERKGGNELLSYISTLEPAALESLTKNAGEEVVDAMKRVVVAVTAAQGLPEAPDGVVDASSFELGQLLFYLMVTGFFLREAEVRIELQRTLGGERPVNLSNLLEGAQGPDSSASSSDSEEDMGPPLPA